MARTKNSTIKYTKIYLLSNHPVEALAPIFQDWLTPKNGLSVFSLVSASDEVFHLKEDIILTPGAGSDNNEIYKL